MENLHHWRLIRLIDRQYLPEDIFEKEKEQNYCPMRWGMLEIARQL